MDGVRTRIAGLSDGKRGLRNLVRHRFRHGRESDHLVGGRVQARISECQHSDTGDWIFRRADGADRAYGQYWPDEPQYAAQRNPVVCRPLWLSADSHSGGAGCAGDPCASGQSAAAHCHGRDRLGVFGDPALRRRGPHRELAATGVAGALGQNEEFSPMAAIRSPEVTAFSRKPRYAGETFTPA